MKKIILATLILLTSVSAFANPFVKGITEANLQSTQNTSIKWELLNSTDVFTLTNYTNSPIRVLIAVGNTVGSSKPSDTISGTCQSITPLTLKAGSSGLCELPTNTSVTFKINPSQFTNGSTGSYTIID